MSLVVPNSAVAAILSDFLETADLTLRLFSNDHSPAKGDEIGDYTEVSGGGYAAITLDKDDWTITEDDESVATQAAKVFSFTGAPSPTTVYGYYVTDTGGTVLKWAERFSEAVVPFEPVNGSDITVNPRFMGRSIF